MRNILSVSISLLSLCFILIGEAKAGMGFDGTNSVSIGSGIVDLVADKTEGAIAVWLKPTNDDGNTQVFTIMSNSGGTTYISMYITYDDDRIGVECALSGSVRWRIESDINTADIMLNKCNLFVVSHDGVEATLYLNGSEINGTFATSTDKADWFKDIAGQADRLIFGARQDQAGLFFAGDVYDVSIFPYKLTADDVANLYNSQGHRWGIDDSIIPDVSGNGLIGTNNGVAISQDGNNWIGTFASADSDIINIGDIDAVDFGTNSWTFSARVKRPIGGAQHEILGKDSLGTTRQFVFVLDSAGTVTIVYWKTDNAAVVQTTSSAPISDGVWHYVTAVRRGDSFEVYVDGIQQAMGSLSGTHGEMAAEAVPLYIGGRSGAPHEYFNGDMDFVDIYGTALASNQIYNISQGTAPTASRVAGWDFQPPVAPPAGWWDGALNLAEGETMPNGTSIIDRSGNGNHGTATNGVTVASPSQADATNGVYATPIPKHKRSRRR